MWERSNFLIFLHRGAKLAKAALTCVGGLFWVSSSVLSSCEPELQELMRQIDLIIQQQKRDWEAELQLVQARLRRREEELWSSRNLLEQKDLEVQLMLQAKRALAAVTCV